MRGLNFGVHPSSPKGAVALFGEYADQVSSFKLYLETEICLNSEKIAEYSIKYLENLKANDQSCKGDDELKVYIDRFKTWVKNQNNASHRSRMMR